MQKDLCEVGQSPNKTNLSTYNTLSKSDIFFRSNTGFFFKYSIVLFIRCDISLTSITFSFNTNLNPYKYFYNCLLI